MEIENDIYGAMIYPTREKRLQEYRSVSNLGECIRQRGVIYQVTQGAFDGDLQSNYLIHEGGCVCYKAGLWGLDHRFIVPSSYPDNRVRALHVRDSWTRAGSVLEHPVFFFMHRWAGNYQHFVVELLPRLVWFLELKHYIPDLRLLSLGFYSDFFSPLGIKESDVLVIARHLPHLCREVYFTGPVAHNFGGVSDRFCQFIDRFNGMTLRRRGMNANKVVYLDRLDWYAGNTGFNRIVTNKLELQRRLWSVYGERFESVYFERERGYASLEEKLLQLEDVDTLITPLGANVINLCFVHNIKQVITLEGKAQLGLCGWFEELFRRLHKPWSMRRYGLDLVSDSKFSIDVRGLIRNLVREKCL